MRVALICDWYTPRLGGIETHLDGLATRLAARGHSVHVITSTPGPSGPPSTGVTIHRLAVNRVPWANVVFQPSAIRQIGDILARERIELAHSHVSIVAPVGIGGAFEAQRRNLPTVVTFHSFVPATPVWAWIVGRLVGASHWNATMTAVSFRVAREVGTFAPRVPFTVLPNAIDGSFWTPSDVPRTRDPISLISVGRLRSKKRPQLLLDAMRELRRVLPAEDVTLRIAGEGPMERPMRRVIEREGLQGVVEFTGWREANGLRELLRGSDAFLSPTVRESFGLAALEARAVGLPVVAMRDSAVADFIRDGESGLLAATDAEFVAATVRIVTDRSLRDRIAGHNRTVRPTLTWERSIALHEATYLRAVGQADHRGASSE